VSRLISAWEKLDSAAFVDLFTETAVWHNIPYPPIEGRANIVAAITKFIEDIATLEFRVHHQVDAGSGIVMNERNDVIAMKDGRTLDIPVMGIFEVEGDRIGAWRDYFDGAAMTG
jgi:limonene-1,2-epoxide hydrolase